MATQGFTSILGEPFVYLENNAGTSSALGIDSTNTLSISVSAIPGTVPSASSQIVIDPAGNITLNPNIKVFINGFTEINGPLKIDPLSAGVMQTDATGLVSSSNGTNGQLLIGGGAAPVWANLTSSGGSVTITNGPNSINLEAAGVAALTQIDADTGSAVPVMGIINIVGGNAISTTAAGNTLTIDALNATTAQIGVAALATNAEAIAGANTTKIVTPDDLKAKLGTQTNHGVLVGAGQTAAVTALAVGATNTVLLGNTGLDPSFGQVPNGALVNSTITLNNGNNITVTGSPISLGGAATIAVSGTTNHGVQVGNASGSLTSLGVGTNGQVLIGATGLDPAFATLTSTGGTITYTTGANTLNIDGTPATTTQIGVVALATNAETIAGANTTKAVTPDDLKAKLGTQTNHGVLVGAGQTAAVTALAVGTTNTVLLGNTGADPSFGQVPNGALVNSTITLNNGNNIAVSGSPVALGGAATISVVGTTNHAVQVGNASASLTSLTVGLNGQILIGATGLNPAFANLTSLDGSITITTGANTLDIRTTAAAGVSSVTGTANQVTASPTTGAVVVSTPVVFIAPGSIASTTTNAAGTNFLMPTTSSTAGQLQINGTRAFHAYGTNNLFGGIGAGNFTLTGLDNTCFGNGAGAALVGGSNNTYIGSLAGAHDASASTNSGNTAVGEQALTAYTGSTGARNTTVGSQSLVNLLTGQHNTVIGWSAGSTYTSDESDNILIGYLTNGSAGEDNTLRIGTDTGTSGAGFLNRAFIQGIAGRTIANSATVLINTTTGQLGTVVSSRRYKHDIEPLVVSNILDLEPVSFRYKEEPDEIHFGFIAEDVASVLPELVTYKNGEPETLRYHEMPALLLAEIKRLSQRVDELERMINGSK